MVKQHLYLIGLEEEENSVGGIHLTYLQRFGLNYSPIVSGSPKGLCSPYWPEKAPGEVAGTWYPLLQWLKLGERNPVLLFPLGAQERSWASQLWRFQAEACWEKQKELDSSSVFQKEPDIFRWQKVEQYYGEQISWGNTGCFHGQIIPEKYKFIFF